MNIGRCLGFGPKVAAAERGMVIYGGDLTKPDEQGAFRALVKLLRDPHGQGMPRDLPIKNDLTAEELALCDRYVKNQSVGLRRLPELQDGKAAAIIEELRSHLRPAIINETDRPVFQTAAISAFRHPEIRYVAHAIAKKYGFDPNILDVAALQRASTILHSDAGAAGLLAEIPELATVPEFARIIDYLVSWMNYGRNGLANYGPFTINGIELSQVIRVRDLPQYKLDRHMSVKERFEVLDKIIQELEEGFTYKDVDRVGYSRVYILGGDGNLYIGIRNDGEIKHVSRGDVGWFSARPLDESSAFGSAGDPEALTRNTGAPERAGTVLNVVNVPSTAFKAATTAGLNLMRATLRKAEKRTDEPLPLYIPTSDGPAPNHEGASGTTAVSRPQTVGGLLATITGAGLTGVLGGYLGGSVTWTGLAWTGALIGASAGGLICGSVWLYMLGRYLSPQSVNPLFGAAGVASTRRVRADEV